MKKRFTKEVPILRNIAQQACGGKIPKAPRASKKMPDGGGILDWLLPASKTAPSPLDKLAYAEEKLLWGTSDMKEVDKRKFARNKKPKLLEMLKQIESVREPNYDVARESTSVGQKLLLDEMKKGGWIQGAVNPKHKGYCTPMTKSTCTPRRKALARRFKSGDLHKKIDGGYLKEYAKGGGLSRDKDYGSKSKPYPSVKSSDFAGGGRSYPIPTKADAVDALRLAGLHGRSDVKAKVYKKYPELKKSLGGFLQDISPLISLIPGAEPIATGIGLAGQLASTVGSNQNQKSIYGMNQMRDGGMFKQYNAPSHAAGGQVIDMNGNPNNSMPVAEIEKQENSYDGYVYSDSLINPDTGKTFAMDAKKIAAQTRRKDDISTSSRILQLMKLKKANDMQRQQNQANQQGVPMATEGIDFSIPLSTTPTMLPIYGNLPTRGGVQSQPRPYPYPYQLSENTGNDFYTVTGDSTPASVTASTGQVPATEAGLSPLNKVAAGLKGASLAYGALDALRRPEQEKLQLPDYSKGDQYYNNLEMDLAPALGEINMASTKAIQDVSNQSGGIGARNSRVNAILARAGKNSAQIQLQQQAGNNQIRAMLGQREDQKAGTIAGEKVRQQTAQSQNDATSRLAARKLFSDLSQVGTSLNNIQYANDLMKNQNELGQQAIQYGLAILSQKYPNFKPDPEFFNRLRSGTMSEADKPLFDQLIQFLNPEK